MDLRAAALAVLLDQPSCSARSRASLRGASREASRLVGALPRRYASQCVECGRRPVRLTRGHCSGCRRYAWPEMSRTHLLRRGCPLGLLRRVPWRARSLGTMGYDLSALAQLVAREGPELRALCEGQAYRGRASRVRALAFLDFVEARDAHALRVAWGAEVF